MKVKIIYLFFLVIVALSVFSFASDKPTIVAIKSQDNDPYNLALRGFRKALEERGIEVSITQFDIQAGIEEGQKIILFVKENKPDLILTIGSIATEIISRGIQDIPIVFAMLLNPVASGLVRTMESSGFNLTGASMDISIETQFEWIKKAVPGVRRIGVLYNPKETKPVIDEALKVAQQIGIELEIEEIHSEVDLPKSLEQLCRKIDVLWSVADSTVFSPQSSRFIILYTLQNQIPFIGLSPSYVKAGALLALSWDYEDIGKQSGEIAVKVLTGENPIDLPITRPRRVSLFINYRTAEQIGIKIPPDVLKKAKEIIR